MGSLGSVELELGVCGLPCSKHHTLIQAKVESEAKALAQAKRQQGKKAKDESRLTTSRKT